MKRVLAPHYQTPPVEPFSKEEIEKLLKVCDFCDEAVTYKKRKFTMRRATLQKAPDFGDFHFKGVLLVRVCGGEVKL
jgi:hypothetical protein